ncbi:MAG: hypothetical protein NVSMB47_09730 [Polyangiales bacterium]
MNRSPLFSIALVSVGLAVGPLAIVACGDDNPPPKDPTTVASVAPMPTPDPTPTMTATATASATETAAPKPPPPTVEDMESSADPKPAPACRILAPANDLSVGDAAKAKDYAVRIDIKNWELGKEGQHAHLILDNGPYKKITDAKAPIKLGELLGPGGGELAEGQHYLILFPSRGTHESVKSKGAASFVTFWVGKKDKTKQVYDGKARLLVYSRPKGDNWGDMGKSVMIDFYLHNETLAEGDNDKVHYTITGATLEQPVTGDFTKWAPKIVKGLPKGDYEVKLELMDKTGKVSEPAAWNSVTRKITVDADHANDPAMGMGPMTMGSASAMPGGSQMAPAANSGTPGNKAMGGAGKMPAGGDKSAKPMAMPSGSAK